MQRKMTVVTGVVVFLIFSFCLTTAEAVTTGWGEGARRLSASYPNHPPLFSNAVAANVWSIAVAHRRDFLGGYTLDKSEIEISTNQFSGAKIPVTLYLQKRTLFQIPWGWINVGVQRAPLVFIIPGIFGGRSDPLQNGLMHELARRGYHVAMMANPFAGEYATLGPKRNPGNIPFEAQVARDIIGKVQERIGARKITKTHLLGFSYGTMIAAAVTALDAEAGNPRVTGTTSLYSPILDFTQTIQIADDYLRVRHQPIVQECQPYLTGVNQWGILLNLALASRQSDLFPVTLKCTQVMMAVGGFFESMRGAVATLHQANGLPATFPERYRGEAGFTAWLSNVSFKSYMTDFAPDVGALVNTSPHFGALGYWIQRAGIAGANRIRILAAKDDHLNRAQDWDQDRWGIQARADVILLPWGGHGGYRPLSWYQEFLDLSWKN